MKLVQKFVGKSFHYQLEQKREIKSRLQAKGKAKTQTIKKFCEVCKIRKPKNHKTHENTKTN